MNTEEVKKLLGQSFLIAFEGLEVPPSVTKFIRENHIGGVTLFAKNYSNPAQVAELINQLQEIAISTGNPPLFIAVDHEGGKVQRFKKPFTIFPESRVIGDKNSPKLAFECAQIMAKELKTVGVNVSYAPLADINTNPKNPVIGRRAFGETEDQVSKMVSAYIRGMLTNGVQPVIKHFPGHGDTSLDSHLALPTVKTPLDVLREREFKPFQKAFKAKCELLMTAHIVVESVDPGIPATLSSKLMKDILRDELHYKGLIISDDMEMKAIADHFGKTESALKAFEAGCDMLIYHTEPFQTEAYEGLMSKLTSKEGAKALDQLKKSYAHILEFKKKNFSPYMPVQIPNIEAVVGAKEHYELAQSLS